MTQISRRGLLKTGAAAGVLAASGVPLNCSAQVAVVLCVLVWRVRTHPTAGTAGPTLTAT